MTQSQVTHTQTPTMSPIKKNLTAPTMNLQDLDASPNHQIPKFNDQEAQTLLDQKEFLEKFGYGKGFSCITKKQSERELHRSMPSIIATKHPSPPTVNNNFL